MTRKLFSYFPVMMINDTNKVKVYSEPEGPSRRSQRRVLYLALQRLDRQPAPCKQLHPNGQNAVVTKCTARPPLVHKNFKPRYPISTMHLVLAVVPGGDMVRSSIEALNRKVLMSSSTEQQWKTGSYQRRNYLLSPYYTKHLVGPLLWGLGSNAWNRPDSFSPCKTDFTAFLPQQFWHIRGFAEGSNGCWRVVRGNKRN